jgi:hypothetical protein
MCDVASQQSKNTTTVIQEEESGSRVLRGAYWKGVKSDIYVLAMAYGLTHISAHPVLLVGSFLTPLHEVNLHSTPKHKNLYFSYSYAISCLHASFHAQDPTKGWMSSFTAPCSSSVGRPRALRIVGPICFVLTCSPKNSALSQGATNKAGDLPVIITQALVLSSFRHRMV